MNRHPKLVFIVTEDWFFASHFLPMLRSARRAGLEAVVLTRVRDHAKLIEDAGARVISLEADRRTLNPSAILKAISDVARILRTEKPDLVHCVALRSIIVGGAAGAVAGVPRQIFAVTGGGLLTARTDPAGRLASRALSFVIRRFLGRGRTRFLFENADDPYRFGLSPTSSEVTIVGGAGVDPAQFPYERAPPSASLKVALVSRMLWSKGVDLAVDAVSMARAKGIAVELSLYGAPDPANRRAIPEQTLREWGARDGITWFGATDDVASVWARHDVACLPSRGGEGLPRTLLEAAASGRAIVTTDVAGCRSFVRDGRDGFVVPCGDAKAVSTAFERLAGDRILVERMGQSARLRVEQDGFTEAAVSRVVEAMYRRVVAEPIS